MATQDLKYYLYRHIRLDKNEPFYIGIGTKPRYYKLHTVEFNRAFCTKHRNNIWKKIYEKTNRLIEVEILFESNDRNFIYQKEKELIALYKPIKNGGTLANLSEGGEGGALGYKHSIEAREKIISALKRRKGIKLNLSETARERITNLNKTPTLVTNKDQVFEFPSVKEARDFLKISIRHMSRLISSGKSTKSGYFIKYKNIIIDGNPIR